MSNPDRLNYTPEQWLKELQDNHDRYVKVDEEALQLYLKIRDSNEPTIKQVVELAYLAHLKTAFLATTAHLFAVQTVITRAYESND